MAKKKNFAYFKRRTSLFLHRNWRLMNFEGRVLPDFLVIGVQKCGTTSLQRYLNEHPGVRPAFKKSLQFFSVTYDKGTDWYRAHFPYENEMQGGPVNGRYLTGEATPNYIYHPLCAERAFSVVPDAKLIVLLRNPVERAYSNYHHMVRTKREPFSFEEAIAAEENRLEGTVEQIKNNPNASLRNFFNYSYLARGRYIEQVENWLQFYPREQFLFLRSEDMFENPAKMFGQISDFLALPDFDLKEYPNANPGRYAPMKDETRTYLNEYFRPYNKRLYALLGIDFGWDA